MGAHILSAQHELRRMAESQSLLTILANVAEKNFQGIITGDESWFAYLIESGGYSVSLLLERPKGPTINFVQKGYDDTFSLQTAD
jgi:hypothetical protein